MLHQNKGKELIYPLKQQLWQMTSSKFPNVTNSLKKHIHTYIFHTCQCNTHQIVCFLHIMGLCQHYSYTLHIMGICQHYSYTLHIMGICQHYSYTLHIMGICQHYSYIMHIMGLCQHYSYTLHIMGICQHYSYTLHIMGICQHYSYIMHIMGICQHYSYIMHIMGLWQHYSYIMHIMGLCHIKFLWCKKTHWKSILTRANVLATFPAVSYMITTVMQYIWVQHFEQYLHFAAVLWVRECTEGGLSAETGKLRMRSKYFLTYL